MHAPVDAPVDQNQNHSGQFTTLTAAPRAAYAFIEFYSCSCSGSCNSVELLSPYQSLLLCAGNGSTAQVENNSRKRGREEDEESGTAALSTFLIALSKGLVAVREVIVALSNFLVVSSKACWQLLLDIAHAIAYCSVQLLKTAKLTCFSESACS